MLLVSVGLAASASAGAEWHTYCNERFGQCADIPPNFESDPPPENGDGLIYRDASGMSVTVSAHYNIESSSLGDERDELLKEKAPPAYQAAGRDWFVVSGNEGDKTYYIRAIVTPGVVATLWIEYPSGQKERYDPLISRISRSFKLLPADGN